MTDNQIIKAFKRCYLSDEINCGNCAFTNCPPNSCITEMTKSVFDLINRQKAEIERLQKQNQELSENALIIANRAKELHSELYEEAKEILKRDTKSEAIREFAERLKAKSFIRENGFEANEDRFRAFVAVCEIDSLVKEMTEESNDQQKT